MLSLLLVSPVFHSIIKWGWTSLFSMLLLNFRSLLGMSSNSMACNYALFLKNLVQSRVSPTSVLLSFLPLRKISLTWFINSWGFLLLWPKDGARLISWMLTKFSSIFLSRMSLWMGEPLLISQCSLSLHPCEVLLNAWDTSCGPKNSLGVNNLGRGSPIIIILAETLNGLDAIHRGKATFFAAGGRGVLSSFRYNP